MPLCTYMCLDLDPVNETENDGENVGNGIYDVSSEFQTNKPLLLLLFKCLTRQIYSSSFILGRA